MIINSSDVTMASHRKYQSATSYSSSGTTWGASGIANYNVSVSENYLEESNDGKSSDGSANSGDNGLMDQFKQAKSIAAPSKVNLGLSIANTIRQQSLMYLFRALFGGTGLEKYSMYSMINQPRDNWMGAPSGGTYSESYYHEEAENTTFSTTGTVKTADGREINFNLSMSMSRSFQEAYSNTQNFGEPLSQGKMCDPLVINIDAAAADVTDQSFYFDLDADGEMDKISTLASGSGFLALDKNGDGVINDGRELFGTQNGDGFADLADYDKDKNGWIDENDEIFHKLRVWCKDKNGNDILYTLKEAGVGAICLSHAATDFALKSYEDNSTNALVRQTGIFLYENGNAGTIQHVDLAKKNP